MVRSIVLFVQHFTGTDLFGILTQLAAERSGRNE